MLFDSRFIRKSDPPVPNGCEELPQPVLGEVAHIVLVEAAEGVLDNVLRVGALQPLAEQGEEHGEVDWSGGLVHHGLQVVLSWVLAQGRQHVVQVLIVNEAVPGKGGDYGKGNYLSWF